MKQLLGERKQKKIEKMIGQPVLAAYTRGGWPHFMAEVFVRSGAILWVNYKTNLKETGKYLDNYKFNEAANLLYGFFWHEFCDWYLELIKQEIKDPANQLVMYKVLEKFLL